IAPEPADVLGHDDIKLMRSGCAQQCLISGPHCCSAADSAVFESTHDIKARRLCDALTLAILVIDGGVALFVCTEAGVKCCSHVFLNLAFFLAASRCSLVIARQSVTEMPARLAATRSRVPSAWESSPHDLLGQNFLWVRPSVAFARKKRPHSVNWHRQISAANSSLHAR